MKRTALKRKQWKPKRKALKKQSKQKISVLQRKLWELCKNLTRKKYGNVCYTCGAQGLSALNWHTGHLFAKASLGAYLKYDLRLLRPQCYKCNINLGGNGANFYRKMIEREGREYLEQIERDKQVTVEAYDHYERLLSEYEKLSPVD